MSIIWIICIVMSLLTILSVLRYKRTVKRRNLKGWHKIPLICFSGLYVIGIGLFVSFFIIAACKFIPRVNRTTKALSLEDAREKCPIALPDGAANIRFFERGQWIAYTSLVKFEAPVEICKQHARNLLESHNMENSDRNPISTQLQKLSSRPTKKTFYTEWFDVHNIEKGLCGGKIGSHCPQIWIDEERGIFYYCYTD